MQHAIFIAWEEQKSWWRQVIGPKASAQTWQTVYPPCPPWQCPHKSLVKASLMIKPDVKTAEKYITTTKKTAMV